MIAIESSGYHYHWPNYGVSAAPSFQGNIESIKQNILSRFLNKMRNYHTNNKNMTDQQLINFLKEVSSGGMIGNQIVAELNNLAFASSGKSDLGTGATFNAMVEGLEPWIPDEATRIAQAINNILDNIIFVLSKSKLDILASQFKQIKSGTPVSEVFQQIPMTVSDGVYPETQLTLAEIGKQASFETLQNCLKELSTLSSSGGGGNLSLADIKASVAGAFNDISGIMLEPVAAHGINLVAEETRKVKKEADNAFIKSGGILTAVQSGNERKSSGAQKKNDIEMTYNKNGLTYSVGGTIKLRQGKDHLAGRGRLENLHNGMTLGRLVELTLADTGQSGLGQYYAAALGAIKSTNSNRSRFFDGRSSEYAKAIQSWTDMKEAAVFSGLAFALAGSGAYGDFSGVLIYNNVIYSIYDLLNKAIRYNKNGTHALLGSITPQNLFTAETFDSVHLRILNNAKTLNKEIKKTGIGSVIARRQTFTAQEIQSLWNKKIEINFSFAKLII